MAKCLAETGARVAVLDCGRPQSDKNFTEHMPAFQLKYRDHAPEVIKRTRLVQKDCYACMEYHYDWFRERPRGALHHAQGHALQLAGSGRV